MDKFSKKSFQLIPRKLKFGKILDEGSFPDGADKKYTHDTILTM